MNPQPILDYAKQNYGKGQTVGDLMVALGLDITDEFTVRRVYTILEKTAHLRFYDPAKRDEQLDILRREPHLIDGALEVVNAVTDLVK